MTVADRAAAVLVLLAGAFAAWACVRAGSAGLAAAAGTASVVTATSQAFFWTRSRSRPRLVLERLGDGRLQARRGDVRPVPLSIGARSRLLGPSVFLDVTFASGSKTVRCRRWITPCDVPAQALRRWTVLLPSAGSLAS